MKMLEIVALENGAHRNQTFNGSLPEGWALVPVETGTLQNFPFGSFEVSAANGLTYMDPTTWVPGAKPAPEPEPDPVPTLDERVAALEENQAAIEDALCEMDAANSASIAALEDALCELDMG